MSVISKPANRARIWLWLTPLVPLLAIAVGPRIIDNITWGPQKRIKTQVSQSHEWLDTAAKIRWALKNAEEIRFYKECLDKKLVVILSERSHADMFRLIKDGTRVGSSPSGLKLDAIGRFVILANGRGYEVAYDPDVAGIILGASKERGQVPSRVKDWLQQVIKKQGKIPH